MSIPVTAVSIREALIKFSASLYIDDLLDIPTPEEFSVELVTEVQSEMANGADTSEAIWDVLAAEDFVPDDEEMRSEFVDWYNSQSQLPS